MKLNAVVIAGLQEAINLEATLSLQYMLDYRNLKRYGLSTAKGMYTLHEQSETFYEKLLTRILFAGGTPTLAPAAAQSHETVTQIITDAIAAETAAVEKFSELAKVFYEQGDMSNFHFLQHLSKWHREGDKGYKGHLAWLEKQAWQLKEFGEPEYEAVKA